jgi:RecB family exonuclease
MELGSALDDGLNETLRPTLMGRTTDLERGVAAMWERIEKIPDDLADKEQRTKEGTALAEALRLFHETHGDWHGQDVQQRFEVTYQGVKIVGIIDRVDADGTIIDHKLDPEWVLERRPQLALYLACAALAEGQEVGTRTKAALEVCYATARLKTPQWTTEAMEIPLAEQQQALEDAATAAFIRDSGVYPARPGKHCQWCNFTAECGTVQSMLGLGIVRIAQAMSEP